jgi:hypothetical protein
MSTITKTNTSKSSLADFILEKPEIKIAKG